MENVYVILSILTIIAGALFFLASWLYIKPFNEKLENLSRMMEKINNTLENLRVDAGSMRTDISVLQRDLKTAFNYIDELKAEIKELKEK
ncbi:MAG: hypothetical protein MJ187_04915 [Alphaproteobacteria bacterium]|nr:hypothetical protein [Alphaproteobacteria bacterium]